jgi:hypothetical protein
MDPKKLIMNGEQREKQKNILILKYLIKFKLYRKKCKNCLNEINTSLTKITKSCETDSDYNDSMNSLTIYSYKFKLNILHMTYYYDKLCEYFN